MDIGWGGVPRMQPSDIALRYLNDNVKVQVTIRTDVLIFLARKMAG